VQLQTKFTHGLIMAVIGAIAGGLESCLTAVPPHLPGKADITAILIGAATVAIGYIGKNLTSGTGATPPQTAAK